MAAEDVDKVGPTRPDSAREGGDATAHGPGRVCHRTPRPLPQHVHGAPRTDKTAREAKKPPSEDRKVAIPAGQTRWGYQDLNLGPLPYQGSALTV